MEHQLVLQPRRGLASVDFVFKGRGTTLLDNQPIPRKQCGKFNSARIQCDHICLAFCHGDRDTCRSPIDVERRSNSPDYNRSGIDIERTERVVRHLEQGLSLQELDAAMIRA